ncbi:MAG: FAD-dependent oxidoreductase [Lentisphaeria bacterium]|nr:MAG: FAD-dependent oxidoreductase [Lentisphaeria bacterium]
MIQHRTCDVAVIGAGAAGLAAAAECARSGLVALAVDREEFAGESSGSASTTASVCATSRRS